MRTIDETTLQSYKNHIYTQEKSQNTIDKYIRDIRTFTAWLQTQEHKDITKDCVIRYKKYLEAHYRPSSTNSMLTALNGFFEYTGWHDCRVMTLKTQPNHIYAQEKEMTRAEYEKLIKTAKEQDNLRLAMIIETIGGTGIRVSELASITVDAVKTGKISISCKGKHREIYLIPKLKRKLLDYCKKKNIKSGVVRLGRRRPPGDEVLHVQGRLLPLEAVPIAEGGEGVGTGVDEACLLLAHHVVHSGKEQEHQGDQVDKTAGQVGAGHLVAGPHPGEEVGHPEAGVLADGGGQLPEQNGGGRIALGIDGIIVLHVAGGEGGTVPLPYAQGAGPEKDIRLLGELHPQGGVCDLPPEGGHPFTVLLVHLGGAERTFHAATPRFSVSVIISESDRPRKEAVQLT